MALGCALESSLRSALVVLNLQIDKVPTFPILVRWSQSHYLLIPPFPR